MCWVVLNLNKLLGTSTKEWRTEIKITIITILYETSSLQEMKFKKCLK